MEYTKFRCLETLAEIYPTIAQASTEIINLQAILNLPKGTEHFLTDIHGEYEAFAHVLKNGSGSVRRKIEDVFGNTLSSRDKKSLATLIYYPELKVDLMEKTEENLEESIVFVKSFAKKEGCIIAVTGAIDLVTDGDRCYVIRNGRPEMGKITGTGCQLSGMMTAYLTANPEHPLDAAAAAVCVMGLAGETAWKRMEDGDGNATYRNRIIDAIYNMTGEDLEKGAVYEVR